MKITIAAKKLGNMWEGALVLEGRFHRSLTGPKLEDLVVRGLNGITTVPMPDGLNVVVDITTETEEEIAAKAAQVTVHKVGQQ